MKHGDSVCHVPYSARRDPKAHCYVGSVGHLALMACGLRVDARRLTYNERRHAPCASCAAALERGA